MSDRSIDAGIVKRLVVLCIFNLANLFLRLRLSETSRIIFFLTFCIKAKTSESLSEARTMRFVSKNTSIPVPKVYCAFRHKHRMYILMEKIDGQPLSSGWCHRSSASQSQILEQLRSLLQQLRTLSVEQVVGVSSIDGGPIYDPRLPVKSVWGPFTTIRDFHRELRNNIEMENVTDDAAAEMPGLRALISFHDRDWDRSVFTHGDLSSLNILARGDEVVGIVDWETAGWMPPYWEYTSAWHVNPQNEFWQREVDGFLTPLPAELEMEKVRRRYFDLF